MASVGKVTIQVYVDTSDLKKLIKLIDRIEEDLPWRNEDIVDLRKHVLGMLQKAKKLYAKASKTS